MKNIFSQKNAQELQNRVNQLNNQSQPSWGKMNVSQMLKHCNIAYDMAFEPQNFKKANSLKKWVLKTFLKPLVVGPKAYKKNSPTSPDFKVSPQQDFDIEKEKLVQNITKTQKLGESYFEGKESISFGKMTSSEWNNLLYKHLDHHLNQFEV